MMTIKEQFYCKKDVWKIHQHDRTGEWILKKNDDDKILKQSYEFYDIANMIPKYNNKKKRGK